MTPENFAFWLQGYFELTDGHGWNSDPVIKCIRMHIEMVKVTRGNYDSRLVNFIGWMESALEFKADKQVVKDKIHSIFEHVIDPVMDETISPEALNYALGGYSLGYPVHEGDQPKC